MTIGIDRACVNARADLAASALVARLLEQARGALEADPRMAKTLVVQAANLLGDGDASCAGATAGGLTPWQLKRVKAHIERNLAEPMSMRDLAAVAKLSASYFGRAFKVSVGEPPHCYVIRRRVEHARKLMLETADPLAAIAVDCGLADQSHLNRVFRRIVGTSPQRWRRAHASAA